MNYIFGKRMDAIMHGGDYNPDQWLDRPDVLQKDIEYMKEAGVNEATLGVFAWAAYEPREGEFHFDWLRKIMDSLYENGIYTILATPSGARPAWLDLKYPEVMRVDGMGHRNRHGFRHNHCLSSPLFREKISIIDRKLAETVGDHPGLLMWHISNEFGGECYCDLCKENFRNYLRKRFDGDIETLNHEWWTAFWSARYNDFDEIEPPYQNGQNAIMGLTLEWKRFTTQNFCDYIDVEIETIRKYSKNKSVPVTTNFMKLFREIDYHTLAKKIDVISWDSYPQFHNDNESFADTMLDTAFDHAMMRGMKKDRPFMLMESAPCQVNWMDYNKLKRPGVQKLASVQAVACGSDTVQYFQWRRTRGAVEQYHSAVIDHRGTNDTRVFREVADTGSVLKKLAAVEGSVMRNEAAVVFDWNNWWAIDSSYGFGRYTKKYDTTCVEYWKALSALGIDADVISADDVSNDYKLIIAPMLYSITTDTAERLKRFVENGGTLLCTYMTGYVNENCLSFEGGFPGNGLSGLFGVESDEIDTLYPTDRNGIKCSVCGGDELELCVMDYAELLRVNDAQIVGTYTDDFYKNTPALTVKSTGRGKAYYQAARCDEASLRLLLEQIANAEGMTVRKAAPGLERHVRYSEDSTYEFLLNDSDADVTIDGISGENIVTGEAVDNELVLRPLEFAVIKKKNNA